VRAARGVLLLGVVMTLGACESPTPQGGTTRPGAPTSTDAPSATVASTLDATVEAAAALREAPDGFTRGVEGVQVSYTVTNDGSEPIKVATDRAPAQAASVVAAPEAVWTSAGSDADVVRLSKQVFGLPDGVLPSSLHRAASATVEPGSSTQDTAFVPLPLRPELPNGTETITVTELPLGDPGAVRRLEICVQIAPGPPVGQDEPYASTIAADAPDTALACSDPIELPEGGS